MPLFSQDEVIQFLKNMPPHQRQDLLTGPTTKHEADVLLANFFDNGGSFFLDLLFALEALPKPPSKTLAYLFLAFAMARQVEQLMINAKEKETR